MKWLMLLALLGRFKNQTELEPRLRQNLLLEGTSAR
jgi:hypothetical protein